MQPLLKLLVIATLLTATNAAEDHITTITAISKTETEKLHATLLAQINFKCEKIDNKAEGDSSMVLYADSVFVEGREFKVNSKLSPSYGQCRYGPVQNEGTRPIYKYKRTLSRTEVSRLESNSLFGHGPINDAEPGDAFVVKTTTWKYGETVQSTQTSYELVSPVKTVSFSCPSNTFCCGLFCCPEPIKSFIDSLPNDYEVRGPPMNATLIDNIKMSTLPILEVDNVANSTVARQCEILFEEGNYYSEKFANAVYYQCPMMEKQRCCSEQLCCNIPEPIAADSSDELSSDKLSSDRLTWVVAITIGLVIVFVLIGCYYYKCKGTSKQGYSKGSTV